VKLFDTTKVPLLGKALDVYTLRQKVIASNIANITTVGYRSKSVTFEDQIAGSLKQDGMNQAVTNEGHISGTAASAVNADPQIIDAPTENSLSGDSLASGLNNVDIDNEMANLAKNQIRFKFAARLLTDTFRDIQDSIKGTES
jgi:flagellar basal-body rod protein FlgB